jgi:hypothetical protein
MDLLNISLTIEQPPEEGVRNSRGEPPQFPVDLDGTWGFVPRTLYHAASMQGQNSEI